MELPVRRWKNQPEWFDEGESIAELQVENGSAQVVLHDGCYYITVGNLFNCQTIRVGPSAHEVLECLHLLSHASNRRPVDLDKHDNWSLVAGDTPSPQMESASHAHATANH